MCLIVLANEVDKDVLTNEVISLMLSNSQCYFFIPCQLNTSTKVKTSNAVKCWKTSVIKCKHIATEYLENITISGEYSLKLFRTLTYFCQVTFFQFWTKMSVKQLLHYRHRTVSTNFLPSFHMTVSYTESLVYQDQYCHQHQYCLLSLAVFITPLCE